MKRKELLGFVFVLLIGFFFRFYRIKDVPWELNNDASWEGLAALDILRGNIFSYFPLMRLEFYRFSLFPSCV